MSQSNSTARQCNLHLELFIPMAKGRSVIHQVIEKLEREAKLMRLGINWLMRQGIVSIQLNRLKDIRTYLYCKSVHN